MEQIKSKTRNSGTEGSSASLAGGLLGALLASALIIDAYSRLDNRNRD